MSQGDDSFMRIGRVIEEYRPARDVGQEDAGWDDHKIRLAEGQIPASLRRLSVRQAEVSASGMIVPMHPFMVIDRQSACFIRPRKTCSRRKAFSTKERAVSRVVPGVLR